VANISVKKAKNWCKKFWRKKAKSWCKTFGVKKWCKKGRPTKNSAEYTDGELKFSQVQTNDFVRRCRFQFWTLPIG